MISSPDAHLHRRTGRTIGVLLLAQIVFAAIANFVLLKPAHYIGLIVAGSMVAAVTMPLFGHRIVFLMLLPLGLSHLALAAWLVAKGFAERGPPAPLAGASTMRSSGEGS